MEREFKRRTGLRKLFNPAVRASFWRLVQCIDGRRLSSWLHTRMRAHTREARIANAKAKDQLDRNSFEPENRTTIKTEQISRDICDALVPSPLPSLLSLSLHPRFSPPFLRVFPCDEMHACNTWSPYPNQTFQVFTIKAEFGVRACASRMNLTFEETTMLYTPPVYLYSRYVTFYLRSRSSFRAEFLSPLFELFQAVDFWTCVHIYIYLKFAKERFFQYLEYPIIR